MNHFDPNSTDSVLSRLLTVLDRVEKRLDDGDAKFEEHDRRIQKLEGWKMYLLGAGAIIGIGFTAGWEWIKSKFH